MKVCNKCKTEKTFECFAKSRKENDGHEYTCKQCTSIARKAVRDAHPERHKARSAKYRSENKEKVKKIQAEWQKNNPEKCREKSRRFYENNKEKEKLRRKKWVESNPNWIKEYAVKYRAENQDQFKKYDRLYLIENRAIVQAKHARRRALKKKATVSWADKEKILAIYRECVRITEETGVEHNVDHIIPLTHKLVCGLHVENNLQIITAVENSRKNNKFQPH